MRSWFVLGLLSSAMLVAQEAPVPAADELSGHPFAIKNKWIIGGTGNWDNLTLDPVAHQLFVAHEKSVQVVDTETGAVTGEIGPTVVAHAIALGDSGEFGFISDGPLDLVHVFDRRSLEVVEDIAAGPNPRALVFEPQTRLLFVVGALVPRGGPNDLQFHDNPLYNPASPEMNYWGATDWGGTDRRNRGQRPMAPPNPRYRGYASPTGRSQITIIDPDKHAEIAEILVAGMLGAAETDLRGGVYVALNDADQILRLDAPAILSAAHEHEQDVPRAPHAGELAVLGKDGLLHMDWTDWNLVRGKRMGEYASLFDLPHECHEPRAMAADGSSRRLFVACNSMKMSVLDSANGAAIASLTIGPEVDGIAFDHGRGLIFTANGGGYGSVTIIRQHLTDSYAVIQNLPTLQHARTLAIDPSSGEIYLVTTLYGTKLDGPPANGIGTLKLAAVDGSFQVLVIGN